MLLLPRLRAPAPLLKGNTCQRRLGEGEGKGQRAVPGACSDLASPLQSSDRNSGAGLTLTLAGLGEAPLPESRGNPLRVVKTDTHLTPGHCVSQSDFLSANSYDPRSLGVTLTKCPPNQDNQYSSTWSSLPPQVSQASEPRHSRT